jgi:hypothetical protein
LIASESCVVYTTDGAGVACGACANPETVTQQRTRTTFRIEKVLWQW